jgi:hypothetical protein
MFKALRSLALLAPVALAACGGGGVFAGTPDSLAYTMQTIEKTDGECRSADSTRTPVPCVTLAIAWPQLADTAGVHGEVQRFVRRLAAASFKNGDDKGSPDSVAAEALAGHAEMRTKHPGYDVPWIAERRITVACNEPGRFGVKVVSNQSTGGLHPASATRFANFDTKTGKRLGLPELVAAGQERAFKESLVAIVERQQRSPETPQLELDVDSFPMPASMLVCGDSLFAQFDVLQFGPHSRADRIVAVKRTDLKGVTQ